MGEQRASCTPTTVISAVMALGALAISGCSEDATPRPVETPAVVWDTRPSGALESDPWVRTLHEGFLALAVATNSLNYVDGAISETWREDIVRRAAHLARRQLDSGTAYVLLGPQPFTPIEVTLDDDGEKAEVAVCLAAPLTVEERPATATDYPERQAMVYGVRIGDDGVRRITGSRQPERDHLLADGQEFSDEYCEAVPIGEGRFDPAPTLDALGRLDGTDVVVPPDPSPTSLVDLRE